MALTKAALAKKLIKGLGMEKPDAQELVNHSFTELKASLQRGEAVKLSGFGHYERREETGAAGAQSQNRGENGGDGSAGGDIQSEPSPENPGRAGWTRGRGSP